MGNKLTSRESCPPVSFQDREVQHLSNEKRSATLNPIQTYIT
jgi:hypothetical protein